MAKAQDLFLDLERDYAGDQNAPGPLLLHARYYPESRKGIEYFGPKATKADVILAGAQVIEAGLDLAADDLHSDLAPMKALVQRDGRSARYEGRPLFARSNEEEFHDGNSGSGSVQSWRAANRGRSRL